MAMIFHRGTMRRSLPVLLALVLSFLVAPQPASSAAADPATTRTTAAVAVHTGHAQSAVQSAARPPVESVAPIEPSAGTEQIPAGPQTVRAQVTADTLGSRAPPSALA